MRVIDQEMLKSILLSGGAKEGVKVEQILVGGKEPSKDNLKELSEAEAIVFGFVADGGFGDAFQKFITAFERMDNKTEVVELIDKYPSAVMNIFFNGFGVGIQAVRVHKGRVRKFLQEFREKIEAKERGNGNG